MVGPRKNHSLHFLFTPLISINQTNYFSYPPSYFSSLFFYLLSSLQVSNHTYGKCSGKKQERKIIFTSYGD